MEDNNALLIPDAVSPGRRPPRAGLSKPPSAANDSHIQAFPRWTRPAGGDGDRLFSRVPASRSSISFLFIGWSSERRLG